MERSEVVRCALLGAAKVAFSAALVGCGGIVIDDRSSLGGGGTGGEPARTGETSSGALGPSSSSADTRGPVATSSSSGVGAGGGSGCDVEGGAPYDEATITCCQKLVVDAFPPGVPTPFPPAPASAELVACCSVTLETQDHGTVGPTPVPWESAYACCLVPGVETPKPFSATCSPWGPPSPPAMPSDLTRIEEAA